MIAGTAACSPEIPIWTRSGHPTPFVLLSAGEYDGSQPLLTDIGVLPGGAQSMPRAMNQAGGNCLASRILMVTNTGGLNFSSANSHAVFWGLTNQTPDYLTNLPPSAYAPYGYGDAYALNDSNQIVGASMTVEGQFVGALWQLNHNTNSTSSTTNARSGNHGLERPADGSELAGIQCRGHQQRQPDSGLCLQHEPRKTCGAADSGSNDHRCKSGRKKSRFDGSDSTSPSNPFRFWINNAQEGGDISGAEMIFLEVTART